MTLRVFPTNNSFFSSITGALAINYLNLSYIFRYYAREAATGASASTAAALSICSRVVNSVAHHSEALPSSGYHFASGNPPMIFFSSKRA